MPSVVIVHAPEDAPPARALAEKLTALGLTPVIGQPPGAQLRDSVQKASAVVALWSPRSTAAPDVVDEVVFARGVKPVIHARMQNAANPADFSGDASIDLTGWRGEDAFPAWRELAQAVAQHTGVTVPAARASSPFFTPGASGPAAAPAPQAAAPRPVAVASEPRPTPVRPAPPPRMSDDDEERGVSGNGKLLIIGLITFIVVVVLGGGGYFAFTQMQHAQATSSAWESVDKTDPNAIRAFLEGEPGARRGEAESTLETLDQQMWEAARATDSIGAYEAYVENFPESRHALQARGRIAELQNAAPGAETTTEAIDPLTGLPYAQDDLVPPDSAPVNTSPQGAPLAGPATGGPTPLQPPAPVEDTPPVNTDPVPLQ